MGIPFMKISKYLDYGKGRIRDKKAVSRRSSHSNQKERVVEASFAKITGPTTRPILGADE
jgi:hypothetical protein